MSDIVQPEKINKNVVRISRLWRTEFDNFVPLYNKMEEGYRYLSGEQFTSKQIAWYKSQRRPTDVFNIIFPVFNNVLGDFYMNNSGIKVFPKAGGDYAIAEKLQQLMEHYGYEGEFDFFLGQTILAGIIQKGYVYPRWSDELEIDGSLVLKNIDEFEVVFDSAAKETMLDDARFVARSRWMSKEEIFKFWPKHKNKLQEYLENKEDIDMLVSPEDDHVINDIEFFDNAIGKYRVIEFHEMELEKAEIAIDPTRGTSEILTLEGKKRLLYFAANPQVQIVEQMVKIKNITTVIPGLLYQLETKQSEIQDGKFDIIPFSAYNYGRKTIDHFGIFQNAKGPQDSYNQWHNRVQDIINKQINAGFIGHKDQLVNPEMVEMYGSQPGIAIWVKEGYNLKDAIQKIDTTVFPISESKLSQEAYEFLYKVVGISPNQMGFQETKQENASLYAQRVNQSKVALTTIYQNIRRLKQRIFQKAITLIQQNLTTERYFVITQSNSTIQTEMVVNQQLGDQILNDLTVGEYKVMPDLESRDPVTKQIKSMQKMELVNVVAQLLSSPVATAIDWKWLLEDTGIGDINRFIESIYQFLGMQMQAQQQQGMQQQSMMEQQMAQANQQQQEQTQASLQQEQARKESEQGKYMIERQKIGSGILKDVMQMVSKDQQKESKK